MYYSTREREDRDYLLSMDIGRTSTFCHMTDITSCGGGGWTLVMKIDGVKVPFSLSLSLSLSLSPTLLKMPFSLHHLIIGIKKY